MNADQQQYAAGCVASTLMRWFDADAAKERANNIVQALDGVNRPADVAMQALAGRLDGDGYGAAVAAVLRTVAPLLPPVYSAHVIESTLVGITIAVTESCVDWGVHVTLRPWEEDGVYWLERFFAAKIVDGRGEEIAECESISGRVEAVARKAAEAELARLVERECGE